MGISKSDIEAMQRRVAGKPTYVIGIDPGRTTGYAVFVDGRMMACESGKPIEIEQKVLAMAKAVEVIGKTLLIVVEDTRDMRVPKHMQSGPERDKGVGGVWAEMFRWESFCQWHGLPFKMKRPSKHIKRKVTSGVFKADFPDFSGRTNHNARDAAYLAKSEV